MVVAATVAWTVHVPTATSVTVAPDTVQMAMVCELKLTGSPDVAVALTVNGKVTSPGAGTQPVTLSLGPALRTAG